MNLLKVIGFNVPMMMWGGDEEETTTQTSTPQFYAAPEFPEAKGAREKSWSTLQGWTPENQYGMIQPNWDDIYSNAAKKVNQYYWGSPLTGGGAMGEVKSDLARRNVQDSPTASILRGRMGVEEANQLGTLRSDVDYKKAMAGETSRMNWLQAMMNLSEQKPAGTWGGTVTQTGPSQDAGWGGAMQGLGYGLGSTLFNAFNPVEGMGNWFRDISGGKPTTMPSSIASNDLGTSDWKNFGSTIGNFASMVPGPQQPFVAGANTLWNMFGG